MAKLVDAPDLGSGAVRHGGSSPFTRTCCFIHFILFAFMAVSFNSTDQNQGVLIIQIPVTEYQPSLLKELNNYKNKAQLKGFRKGKTSVDVIKKMYGNGILQEVVENNLQKQLFDHIQEANINILGQPLPNAEQEAIYYNIMSPTDYTFKFDIGFAPDFEVKGLDQTYDYRQVAADQKSVDDQLAKLRDRSGELKIIETEVQEEHLVTIDAREVENGQIKENGVRSEFSIWLSQLEPEAQKEFLGKKTGDEWILAIRGLHQDKDDAFIRQRYFNTLEENVAIPEMFSLQVTEIKANEPAVLDQAFFDKMFGENKVTTIDQANEKIREEIEKQIGFQADALLFRDIQDNLLKINKQDLPDTFLKRWLKVQNAELTDERVEAEYPDFVQNLLWTLIREKLVKKYTIEVSKEDIKNRFRQQILSYFGGMAMGDLSFMEPTIDKMMQNREQVEKLHEEILTDKIFDQIKSNVDLNLVPTSESEFKELMEAARKDTEARRQKSLIDDHDHDHDHNHDHHHHDHSDHSHSH